MIDNRNGIVTLHFDLDIQNKKQIETALMKGENLHLILTVSLYEKKFFFWNSSVSSKKIIWQLSSNPVTRQLTIRQDLTSTVLAPKDFWNTLNRQMEKLKIPFIDWGRLGSLPEQYSVVLEIKLGRDLPNWVKIVEAFWQDGLEQNIRYEMALNN